MPRRNEADQALYVFANALRECLGLDPIYQDGRSLNARYDVTTDEYRFYVHPAYYPGSAVDASGRKKGINSR